MAYRVRFVKPPPSSPPCSAYVPSALTTCLTRLRGKVLDDLPVISISSPGFKEFLLIPADIIVVTEESSPIHCTSFPWSSWAVMMMNTWGFFQTKSVTTPFVVFTSPS